MILRPIFLRTALHNPTAIATKTARSPTSFNLRLRHRPLLLTSAALGFSLPFLAQQTPTLLDTPFSTSAFSASSPTSARESPVSTNSRTLSPKVVKQISLGSILGLGAGVLLSAFSRSLNLLFGVGIVVVQYAARQGYNIIPVTSMQKYIKSINLRSAIHDNAAFKISFGLAFALAAFGGF